MDERVAAAVKDVVGDFRRKFKEFQEAEPFWQVVQGFVHAVDWQVRERAQSRSVVRAAVSPHTSFCSPDSGR